MQVGVVAAVLQCAERIVKVKELPARGLFLAQAFQPRQTVLEALQGLLSVGHDVLQKRNARRFSRLPTPLSCRAWTRKPSHWGSPSSAPAPWAASTPRPM